MLDWAIPNIPIIIILYYKWVPFIDEINYLQHSDFFIEKKVEKSFPIPLISRLLLCI